MKADSKNKKRSKNFNARKVENLEEKKYSSGVKAFQKKADKTLDELNNADTLTLRKPNNYDDVNYNTMAFNHAKGELEEHIELAVQQNKEDNPRTKKSVKNRNKIPYQTEKDYNQFKSDLMEGNLIPYDKIPYSTVKFVIQKKYPDLDKENFNQFLLKLEGVRAIELNHNDYFSNHAFAERGIDTATRTDLNEITFTR